MKEKPSRPPSKVAEVAYEPLNFKESFRAIYDNPNFLKLVISFSIPYGAVLALGALMSNIFVPFGYAPGELALFALTMLFSGIAGAIVIAIVLDKTGWYKWM